MTFLNNSTFWDNFTSAEILVVNARQKIGLTAFGDMITELLGNDDVTPTEEALLRSRLILELKYQNSETVQEVC